MATETQSSTAKLGTPGKILIWLFAVLMICLLGWAGASQASAAPAAASIGVGDVVNLQPQAGLPYHQLKDGGCNAAAIDRNQRKLVTAGHCGKVGDRIFSRDVYIGTVVASVAPEAPHNTVSASVLDYAVVQLASHVDIKRDPITLKGVETQLHVGMAVYKHGHGIGNSIVRRGVITKVTPNGIETNIATSPFDSGSPIIASGSDKLVAIVSGMVDPMANARGILRISERGNSVGTQAKVVFEETGLQIEYDLAG